MVKKYQYDGKADRTILIGMVTNDTVLAKVASVWDKDPLKATASNIVGQKCVSYFNKHGKAPGRHIQDIMDGWAQEGNKDKAVVTSVREFLESLSDEYERTEELNSQYIIDLARKQFTVVKVDKLYQSLENLRTDNRYEEAVQEIKQFSESSINQESGTGLIDDEVEVNSTFSEEGSDLLVSYPGPLGEFFGADMSRDNFVAFAACEKKGKTWQLIDLAYRGLIQKRRVVFFEVGDMSLKQIKLRFLVRIAKHPSREQTVKYPTGWGNKRVPITKPKEYKVPLDAKRAWEACKALTQRFNQSYFHIQAHPAGMFSVENIRTTIIDMACRDWLPDICVIDYADILAPPSGTKRYDLRDRINESWIQMRSLASEFHMLVATATQATRAAQKADVLRLEHLSDDKRKAAHPTAIYGLNQTDQEKEDQVMRINCMARREGEFSVRRCIHIAQCLPLGNPCVLSTL